MSIEIERKFLVKDDTWQKDVFKTEEISQGYLANTELTSIRVRLSEDKATLNIKSMTLGVTRTEYEYPIPLTDARSLLGNMCIRPLIEKTRHHINCGNHTWEVDVFEGDNTGLIVAEIELNDKDEQFERPDWLGQEVSNEPRYYNVCLLTNPYSKW